MSNVVLTIGKEGKLEMNQLVEGWKQRSERVGA
jgi:hypothetical protein